MTVLTDFKIMPTTSAHRQSGVTLIISLVVVVMMTIVGVAMMRQMGLGLSIAGNLAFKQNATFGADLGVETAFAFLTDVANQNTTTLSFDQPDQNYFSNWDTAFSANPTTWAGWADIPEVEDDQGNRVQYVIHRLCETAGWLPTAVDQKCTNVMMTNKSYKLANNVFTLPPYPSPYYRITTRVQGPRNTMSYTQVIVMN